MNMYINPYIAGMLTIILVETLALLGIAIWKGGGKKK